MAGVQCASFDVLWKTATEVARRSRFTIDRTDYREGLLTTSPLVSKQPFEFWRADVADEHSMAQSALGTVRRTVHFQISREKDGGYRCVPKVLVERESYAECRITSVNEYKDVFSYTRALSERGTDEDQPLQIDYWYAIGRDNALENRLAGEIRKRLSSQQCGQ